MACGGGQEAVGGGEPMDDAGPASPPPIAQLGYDQVLSVLRLLPAEAVLSFAATCRGFRAWATSDALWEALCRRDWGARAAAGLAERRRGAPWRRVYAEVARLGALSARRVPVKGASPRPRASHSLNLVAGWLVLFGGGCEGDIGRCSSSSLPIRKRINTITLSKHKNTENTFRLFDFGVHGAAGGRPEREQVEDDDGGQGVKGGVGVASRAAKAVSRHYRGQRGVGRRRCRVVIAPSPRASAARRRAGIAQGLRDVTGLMAESATHRFDGGELHARRGRAGSRPRRASGLGVAGDDAPAPVHGSRGRAREAGEQRRGADAVLQSTPDRANRRSTRFNRRRRRSDLASSSASAEARGRRCEHGGGGSDHGGRRLRGDGGGSVKGRCWARRREWRESWRARGKKRKRKEARALGGRGGARQKLGLGGEDSWSKCWELGRHLDDTWVAYAGNRLPSVLNWQQLASGTPSGRFSQSCTLIGDTLVLFGGITDCGQRLNDTWIGQIISEETRRMRILWRLLEVGPLAPPPRGAHAACCVDDKFIIIHGGIGLYGSRLGDTWLLDLSNGLGSGSWHQIGHTWPLPPPRSGHSLTWIGGTRMVLFGGRGSEFEVLNDVWLFDISDQYPKWKELKYNLSSALGEMPFPRVGHSAILVLGGKVLVYGGEDSQRRRKDDFWILDIAALLQHESGSKKMTKRMWKKLRIDGQCPNYRSFHGACVDTSGCSVYILGGMVDGLVHAAEALGLRFDGQLYQVELVLHL
ncbi:hypothetical protein EJB05_08427 [Eragrostis curvula]|uniref:F-box domain-containing protein n=1 Tax=Eragrostis curvula TaxID=38414 RepID=A0A5J9W3H4_9POAL|nr:hypothetical protein EJB05_08427 [Eragrostis curvula]